MKRGGVKNTKKVCPWLYGWLRSSYCIDSSCFGILLLMQCSAVIKMRNLQFCVFPILSAAASFDHGHISLHATLLCRWDIYYLDRCHTSSCVRFYFWKNDALLNSYWYLSSLSEAERGSFQKQAAKQQNLQALPQTGRASWIFSSPQRPAYTQSQMNLRKEFRATPPLA